MPGPPIHTHKPIFRVYLRVSICVSVLVCTMRQRLMVSVPELEAFSACISTEQ